MSLLQFFYDRAELLGAFGDVVDFGQACLRGDIARRSADYFLQQFLGRLITTVDDVDIDIGVDIVERL